MRSHSICFTDAWSRGDRMMRVQELSEQTPASCTRPVYLFCPGKGLRSKMATFEPLLAERSDVVRTRLASKYRDGPQQQVVVLREPPKATGDVDTWRAWPAAAAMSDPSVGDAVGPGDVANFQSFRECLHDT